MQQKKILVTGAGGFIGSHLVQSLVHAGAEVKALLHYNAQNGLGNLRWLDPGTLAAVNTVHGDLSDGEFMKRVVEGVDAVFHLGALIAIPHSYSAPRSYVETNVLGTLNVLEAVKACETPRMVHVSTSEVYGSARYIPMDEAHPLQAQSPYAATKIGADKLVESYVRSFGVRAVTVRPFNTFGPRQSARAVIPAVIAQALSRPSVIQLGTTTPVRDLTFVSDTVDGFITAATAPDSVVGGCYNLGTGQGIAIGDLARTILDLMGVSARIEEDPRRLRPAASEVDRLVSNHQAFRAATGWQPRVSLAEGLQRTIEFFQAHPDELPRSGFAQ